MTSVIGNQLVHQGAAAPEIIDLLWTIKDDLDLFLDDPMPSSEVPRLEIAEEPFPESILAPEMSSTPLEFDPVLPAPILHSRNLLYA